MGIGIQIEGLTKSLGSPRIWEDVTFDIPPGEVSVLLGPSGTGKSVFLKSLIGLLRPEYRTAILLRHVEGRPYEEIAEIMSIPLGTVKTYIHRARGELRETLAHLRIGT